MKKLGSSWFLSFERAKAQDVVGFDFLLAEMYDFSKLTFIELSWCSQKILKFRKIYLLVLRPHFQRITFCLQMRDILSSFFSLSLYSLYRSSASCLCCELLRLALSRFWISKQSLFLCPSRHFVFSLILSFCSQPFSISFIIKCAISISSVHFCGDLHNFRLLESSSFFTFFEKIASIFKAVFLFECGSTPFSSGRGFIDVCFFLKLWLDRF